jgi:hypothetical protein
MIKGEFLQPIKSEFLLAIRIAWPNEISGDDKKRFYRLAAGFACNLPFVTFFKRRGPG